MPLVPLTMPRNVPLARSGAVLIGLGAALGIAGTIVIGANAHDREPDSGVYGMGGALAGGGGLLLAAGIPMLIVGNDRVPFELPSGAVPGERRRPALFISWARHSGRRRHRRGDDVRARRARRWKHRPHPGRGPTFAAMTAAGLFMTAIGTERWPTLDGTASRSSPFIPTILPGPRSLDLRWTL